MKEFREKIELIQTLSGFRLNTLDKINLLIRFIFKL